MTTILTDADGNKFELVPQITGEALKHLQQVYALKPVQPEEEKEELRSVNIHMHVQRDSYTVHGQTLFTSVLSESQTEALADAVKALVEYCTTDTPGNVYVRDAADRARQALQGKKVG